MIRVVLDTNILVSALLSPKSNEAVLILAIQADVIVPCLSKTILNEYIEVLTRPKFNFKQERVSSLLELFRDKGSPFEPVEMPHLSPDPTDTKFLQCAFAAMADFIVTGNKRHFPSSPYGPTRIVNAREFISQITPDIPLST